MSERTYLKFCDKLHDEVGFHAATCPVCAAQSKASDKPPSIVGFTLSMLMFVFAVLSIVLGLPFSYTFDGVPHSIQIGPGERPLP